MSIPKLDELRKLSAQDVIERYDSLAPNTRVGTDFWIAELNRRYLERKTNTMVTLTKWIMGFTAIVTIATLVNVAVIVFR